MHWPQGDGAVDAMIRGARLDNQGPRWLGDCRGGASARGGWAGKKARGCRLKAVRQPVMPGSWCTGPRGPGMVRGQHAVPRERGQGTGADSRASWRRVIGGGIALGGLSVDALSHWAGRAGNWSTAAWKGRGEQTGSGRCRTGGRGMGWLRAHGGPGGRRTGRNDRAVVRLARGGRCVHFKKAGQGQRRLQRASNSHFVRLVPFPSPGPTLSLSGCALHCRRAVCSFKFRSVIQTCPGALGEGVGVSRKSLRHSSTGHTCVETR